MKISKKLNKSQRVLRWASNKKVRPVSHMMTELGYTNKKALMFLLNRLVRFGLINYKKVKVNSIEFSLTQSVYYNRSLFIV